MYNDISQDNYEETLSVSIKDGDLKKIRHIFDSFSTKREDRNKGIRQAINIKSLDILEYLLSRGQFDLTDSGDKDIKNTKEIFKLASLSTKDIWDALVKANEKTSHGKIKFSIIKSIAFSEDSSYDILHYYAYRLVNKNTLEKLGEVSHGISLTTLFNFHSCQQTTIVEKNDSIGVTVNDFNFFNNRDFFDEIHQIYEKLGGKRPHPLKIHKPPQGMNLDNKRKKSLGNV